MGQSRSSNETFREQQKQPVAATPCYLSLSGFDVTRNNPARVTTQALKLVDAAFT
jgi:hypothetical protein